jgi:hypothetical protein
MELIMYQAATVSESEGFWEGTQKCALQTILVCVSSVMALTWYGRYYMLARNGKLPTFLLTVFIALFTDQTLNLVIQPFVHFIVTRQCGTIQPGLQEYNAEYIAMFPPQPSSFQVLQEKARELLRRQSVKVLSTGLVIFYSIFIMIRLFMDPYLREGDYGVYLFPIFDYIHNIVLFLFMVEIIANTLAWGTIYWRDKWTVLDNGIVLVCVITLLYAPHLDKTYTSVILLRLLKPLRVLLVYRRKSGKRKKQKEIKEKSEVSVNTNVETVLDMIDELLLHKSLSQHQREDLEWVEQVLVEGLTLYQPFIEQDSLQGMDPDDPLPKFLEEYMDLRVEDNFSQSDSMKQDAKQKPIFGQFAARWKKSKTKEEEEDPAEKISRLSQAQDKKKEKAEKSKKSADSEKAANSFVSQLYQLASVNTTEEAQIEQALVNFDMWNIDLQPVVSLVEANAIAVIFLRCMMRHDILQNLTLDFERLFNACQHVQLAAHPHVHFHGSSHACAMIHAVHYFCMHEFKLLTDDFELFTLFFSCLAVHYAHPGFSNEFLTKIRHPRAMRYNDRAVLEMHNLSRVTMLLSDPECNFTHQMDRMHADSFRALMIRVILKMDLSQHFNHLSRLQTKLASEIYPGTKTWLDLMESKKAVPAKWEGEDRCLLLFSALRCADISWACHAPPLSTRWGEKFVEEFFNQGDIEKQVGIQISPFSDRDIVQPQKAQMGFLTVIVMPLYTMFIFTLREGEQKHGIQKDLVDELEKEIIEDGIEATHSTLHNKVLQAAR